MLLLELDCLSRRRSQESLSRSRNPLLARRASPCQLRRTPRHGATLSESPVGILRTQRAQRGWAFGTGVKVRTRIDKRGNVIEVVIVSADPTQVFDVAV